MSDEHRQAIERKYRRPDGKADYAAMADAVVGAVQDYLARALAAHTKRADKHAQRIDALESRLAELEEQRK